MKKMIFMLVLIGILCFNTSIYLMSLNNSTSDLISVQSDASISTSSIGDYLGLYSFTDDVVGSDPLHWVVTEPGTKDVRVTDLIGGHYKVMQIVDDTSSSLCVHSNNTFTARTNGAIEMWIRTSDASNPTYIGLFSSSSRRFQLAIDNEMWYHDGSGWTSFRSCLDDVWYHLRITFECGFGNYDALGADQFNIYIDGIKYGPYNFWGAGSSINQLCLSLYDPLSFATYFDAIDYSWAPGYYTNRNTDTNLSIPGLEFVWVFLTFAIVLFLCKKFQVKTNEQV